MTHPTMHMLAFPDRVVLRAIQGETSARSELLSRHGALVWGICRRLSPDPEDDYQTIWEKVFRALSGFDPHGPAQLSTWIATIAHRHLVDQHRRRKVRGEVVEVRDLPADQEGPERGIDAVRDRKRLERALSVLPEDQRRVVVLHHLDGVPLDSIAATESVAVGTVKSRLHRGRARLLEQLRGR